MAEKPKNTAAEPTPQRGPGPVRLPYVPPFYLPADDTSANTPVEASPPYAEPITGDALPPE